MVRSLYNCYFGIQEPLVQTQVLPYLRELVKDRHEMVLLTFESESLDPETRESIREELKLDGIEWHSLRYHKRLSAIATAFDIIAGTLVVRRLIKTRRIDLLHGRVHVPTLMAALARKLSRTKPKLIFDIRGFFPEEYADAGVWPTNGVIFRTAKWVERWLLKEADGFVVLTKKASRVLFPESSTNGTDGMLADSQGRPVEVIPCCVDLNVRFEITDEKERSRARKALGLDGRFVVVHLGALGGLYLNSEIVELLAISKNLDPSTFGLFVTQTDPKELVELLRKRGFTDKDILVTRAPAEEVAKYLHVSDVGVSFVKATFATLARSPTKIPEYLACGLPIIANAGVGDVDELVEGQEVGALVRDMSPLGYEEAIRKVLAFSQPAEHMRAVAAREFSLDSIGGERYRRLYSRLLASEAPTAHRQL